MVRYTKIILLILLAFNFSKVEAKSPPSGTGTADVPANILIMLDNSGSMSSQLQSSVQLYYPIDVNVDSQGNVYVLEYYSNTIKVFNSSGNFIRSFGGYGSSCNRWAYARQFEIDGDYIYIADTYNHRVTKLTLTGSCVWIGSDYRGSGGRSPGGPTGGYPHGVTVGGGYVFVSNYVGHVCSFRPGDGVRVYQYCEQPKSNYIWGISY